MAEIEKTVTESEESQDIVGDRAAVNMAPECEERHSKMASDVDKPQGVAGDCATVTVATTDVKEKVEDECNTKIQDKDQELPEPIRHKEGSRGMMQGLPSINLNELTTILLDPSMPSQKIMKEVADKIMLKSEESESDDGSVGSAGGLVGMKGLLDCIFEVSYKQTDSDNSDDDDSFERIPREIPCNFCDKIFGSTMTWKTHVLVAHQDPSVLNIRRLSASEIDKKERNQPTHRRHSRTSSKADSEVKDTKVQHSSTSDKKSAEPDGEDNFPAGKRCLSASRIHQKETSSESQKSEHQLEKVSLPPGDEGDNLVASNESMKQKEDVSGATCERKTSRSAVPDLISGSHPVDSSHPGGDDKQASLAQGHAEPTVMDQNLQRTQSSQASKHVREEQVEGSSVLCDLSPSKHELGGDAVLNRKRKATSPSPESPTSSPCTTPSNPKHSRKIVEHESPTSSQS